MKCVSKVTKSTNQTFPIIIFKNKCLLFTYRLGATKIFTPLHYLHLAQPLDWKGHENSLASPLFLLCPSEGSGSGFLLSGSWSTHPGSCLTGYQRGFKFSQPYDRYWCRGHECRCNLLLNQLICLIRFQDTLLFGRKAFHYFLMAVYLWE